MSFHQKTQKFSESILPFQKRHQFKVKTGSICQHQKLSLKRENTEKTFFFIIDTRNSFKEEEYPSCTNKSVEVLCVPFVRQTCRPVMGTSLIRKYSVLLFFFSFHHMSHYLHSTIVQSFYGTSLE